MPPQVIRLSPALVEALDTAWALSLPVVEEVQTAQEQGGIFVQRADGSFEWRPGEPGEAGSFSPNWDEVRTGEVVTALVHTHPYSESEGGFTDVPFSGQDMGLMVLDGLYGQSARTSLVRSGDTTFLLALSAELQDRIAGLSDSQKVDLWKKIKGEADNAIWEYARAQAGEGASRAEWVQVLTEQFREASVYSVKTVAERYEFLFYAGRGDTLRRVN